MKDRSLQVEFGLAVRALRVRFGLSQCQLAMRTGVHRTYISNVEQGNCNPSLVTIAKLAAGLGTSISTLTGGLEIKLVAEPDAEAAAEPPAEPVTESETAANLAERP